MKNLGAGAGGTLTDTYRERNIRYTECSSFMGAREFTVLSLKIQTV